MHPFVPKRNNNFDNKNNDNYDYYNNNKHYDNYDVYNNDDNDDNHYNYYNDKEHLNDRWLKEVKHPNMQKKYNHAYSYMLNAEHNCRLDLLPYPGEPNQGVVKTYDDIFDATKKSSGNDYATRMQILSDGFQRYINEYYYARETTKNIQGCDGKHVKGKVSKGKQYRLKRLLRKIAKPIRKVVRRKRQDEKRKNQQDE
ncbi:Oidioi.mRNA.OKI2018_I69.chr2.g4857.t1.cds [Oikopleura dioica]|uniref:Oidioi.mRNA.OKI2018_I69.chr2.g4857.t1.cds n=1 Tax=Oikopleura dioica TaxID=34765 RepID=A0ABN7SYC5_OIKDI|nr:Oidioi.mRNA.OKI2018_I69.chr2.g4857.t1.cds [Oikopleura dioica]